MIENNETPPAPQRLGGILAQVGLAVYSAAIR
jgi:hypothetical protein